jgi:hypothetical protein
MSDQDTERAIKIVERLIRAAPNKSVVRFATRMHDRLSKRRNAIPMSEVIEKIPGTTVMAKARSLGVTRQAFYYWINGETRPNEKQAKAIHKLTGFSVEEIRGLSDA